MQIRDTKYLASKLLLQNNIYEGLVVDNRDPEQKSRIKVAIYNVTDKIKVEHLPWYSIGFPVTASNNSKTSIPPINSRVLVKFYDNDIYNGLVVHSIVSKPPTKR